MSKKFVLVLDPMGAVRQVRSDRWRRRDSVVRYRSFRDSLRFLWAKTQAEVPSHDVEFVFVIEMPKSWSAKKKKELNRQPHKSKPDLDNLLKAFFDALLEEDSHVHHIEARKVWGEKGQIEVTIYDEQEAKGNRELRGISSESEE